MSDVNTQTEAETPAPVEETPGSALEESLTNDEWEASAGTPPHLADETPAEVPATDGETEVVKIEHEEKPEPAEVSDEEKDHRRGRGWLETDVVSILKEIVTGTVAVDREKITPHRVSRLVQSSNELASPPSTGAVSDVFKRLAEIGYIEVTGGPYRFVDFTDAAREHGLKSLKAKRSETLKAERAARKAAAAPAPVTEAPAETPANEVETVNQ